MITFGKMQRQNGYLTFLLLKDKDTSRKLVSLKIHSGLVKVEKRWPWLFWGKKYQEINIKNHGLIKYSDIKIKMLF